MTPDNIEFRTGVIKPVECLKEGWALIKDQYWLFLGIVIVGIFVGGAVPLVLIGPMMVGIYLCFFRRMRGETVEFGTLFKGFDYFAQGLIAALIQMIPMVVVMVPAYIIMFVLMMTSLPRGGGSMDPEASSRFLFTFFGFELVFLVVMIAVGLIVGIFFMFAFPLIADRGLSGLEATKLSIKAGKANFGGILSLLLLNFAIGMLGVLACYIGVFFIMPISLASYAVAYRRVFPPLSQNFASPPPPPANWAT
ncbi:MAG: hypothetical protein QOH42_1965 [Blastocatellia bacterium]|jgi:uncharacterized membrane protein|nr:hypothetical protein [Blastocatellia bacterium]